MMMLQEWFVVSLVTVSTVILMMTPPLVNAAPPSATCVALQAFFNNSNGPQWFSQSEWNKTLTADSNCCEWQGIQCDDNNSAVTTISLPQNNIIGTLPPSWATDLPNLTSLDLSRNMISGSLPSEYSKLRYLVSFTMETTNLTGTLPDSWGALPALQLLSLSYNHIEGSIPMSWGSIATIRWMYIGHNKLNGTIPPLQACTLLLCGNEQLTGELHTMNWTSFGRKHCAVGVSIFLIGTSVFGNIPCIPFIGLWDVSYTLVTGEIPCCQGLGYLAAEGSNVTGWSSASPCVSTTLTSLFISYTGIRSFPLDLGIRFPNLQHFTARSLGISQLLPFLPASLTILDLAGNALSWGSSAMGGDPYSIIPLNVSSAFQYLDLTTTSVAGISLANTDIRCNGNVNDSSCAVKTGVFTALGSGLIQLANKPLSSGAAAAYALDEASIITPMMIVLPDRRIALHIVLSFMDLRVSGMYRPSLFFDHAMDHVSATVSDVQRATLREPQWNATYVPISPVPSGIVLFDGMVGTPLLYGVVYRLEVQFVYRPVLLLGPAPRQIGSLVKNLIAGSLSASPCTPTTLYAVPLTTLCSGCPSYAVCDGTSLLHADGAVWRIAAGYLPFYPCDSRGCISASPRVGTECAPGFTGLMCSTCASNYGKDSTGNCVTCSPAGWNWVIIVVGSLAFIGATTFAATKSVPVASSNAASVAFASACPSSAVMDGRNEDGEEGQDNSKNMSSTASNTSAIPSADVAERINQLRAAQAAVAVKKIQNHLGMYALVGRTVFASDKQAVSVALQTIQQFASEISLRSISFVTCVFPSLNAVSQFQAILVIIPALLITELALVRVVRGRWAWVSVISSTVLLCYESAINIALQLIPTDDMSFYDATQFTVNRTGAVPAVSIVSLSLDRQVPWDGNTRGWRAFAYVWLVLFGVGFPLVVMGSFVMLRDRYGYSYAKDHLGFIMSNYRSKRWYWESAIMLRKMSLAVAVVGLRNYPLAQMQAVIAVLMIYVVTLEWQVPFSSVWMHHAERVSCYGAILISNVLMAKGSLSGSLSDETSSTQDSGYTIFVAVMRISTLLGMLGLLYAEWRRGVELLSGLDGEEVVDEGGRPLNLDQISIDTPPDETVSGVPMEFNLHRVCRDNVAPERVHVSPNLVTTHHQQQPPAPTPSNGIEL